MSSNEHPNTTSEGPAVPHLVEEYRSERTRWLEHARELERLRSEVRTAAEREAEVILGAARSEIRRVVQDARRELLVLIGQVQAVGCEGESDAPADSLHEAREAAVMARRGMQRVLAEAKADLRALSEEASALRAEVARSPNPRPVASRALLSEAAGDHLEEPVPQLIWWQPWWRRPAVAGGVAAAALLLAVILWTRSGGPAPETLAVDEQGAMAGDEPAAAEPPPEPMPAAPPALAPSTSSLVLLEALRPVWVRSDVDGRRDRGRTLRAGQVLRFSPSSDVVVRVGDAGALLLSSPGEVPRLMGRDGEVVTRRLTSARPAAPPQSLAAPVEPQPVATTATSRAPAVGAPAPASGFRSAPSLPILASRSTAPPPAPAPTATAIPGVAPGGSTPDAAEAIIRARERQWFDAYYRGDRATLASLSTPRVSVSDERPVAERTTPGSGSVERTIDDVHVVVSGNSAVLSGRARERVTQDGIVRESLAWVSEVWIQDEDGWKMMGVRLRNTPGQQ